MPYVLAVYAAGAVGWLIVLRVDATYHEFAVFLGIVAFHGLVGAALGRAWGIALPLLLIPALRSIADRRRTRRRHARRTNG